MKVATFFFGVVLLGVASHFVQGRVVLKQSPLEPRVGGNGATYNFQSNVQSSAFDIRFQCNSTAEFCGKVERVLSKVGERIASEFLIKQTIVVDLAMFSPCGSMVPIPNCPENNILGFASPTTHVPVLLRPDKQIYLFPSALLKQLDVEGVDKMRFPTRDEEYGDMMWPTVDIFSRFNAAKNWYFAEDNQPIHHTQRNLELVVMHELMHGLGFGDDNLITYQPDIKAKELMPHTNVVPDELAKTNQVYQMHNGPVFSRFAGPTIWNRCTYLKGEPLVNTFYKFEEALERFKKAGQLVPYTGSNTTGIPALPGLIESKSVIQALKNDATTKKLMEYLYTAATTNGTLVLDPGCWIPNFANTPNVTLETGIPFASGSTASHVLKAYNTTKDFLMVRSFTNVTLEGLIKSTGAPSSGIGPLLSSIMTGLGLPPARGPASSLKNIAVIAWLAGRNPGDTTPPPYQTRPDHTSHGMALSPTMKLFGNMLISASIAAYILV
jgi:hypothetical protein